MKPGDFLIGVFDFFAVILPGSIATWLLTRYIPAEDLKRALTFDVGGDAATIQGFALGFAFLLASYTLGHFVFMAGAKLDPTYDRWRERMKPKARDKAFQAAVAVQKRLNPELIGGDFSTLKWARTYVQIKAAAARSEIDRLEADQKFFRSLVVVGAALALHFFLGRGAPFAGLIAVLMTVLAFQRYIERRWVMSELIFATAAIAAAAGSGPAAKAGAATDGASEA